MLFFFTFYQLYNKTRSFFISLSKISYPDLIDNYNSCEGKGFIVSKGEMHGKLYFSFKSQRDSTFIDFSDFLGRKTILMWVTPEKLLFEI